MAVGSDFGETWVLPVDFEQVILGVGVKMEGPMLEVAIARMEDGDREVRRHVGEEGD